MPDVETRHFGFARPDDEGLTNPVADFYNTIAKDFFAHRKEGHSALDVIAYPTLWKLINGSMEYPADIIDLACGTGAFTHELLKRFGYDDSLKGNKIRKILGVDISEGMLEIAKREIDDPRVKFIQSSISEMLGVPSNEFGWGICVYGFDYVSVSETLDEVSRVLKPGGRLLILLPHEDRYQEYWKNGGNQGEFSDGWMNEWILEGGDKPVRKQYLHKQTWIELIQNSNFKLIGIHEPTLESEMKNNPELREMYPDLVAKYTQTPHRIIIMDMINSK